MSYCGNCGNQTDTGTDLCSRCLEEFKGSQEPPAILGMPPRQPPRPQEGAVEQVWGRLQEDEAFQDGLEMAAEMCEAEADEYRRDSIEGRLLVRTAREIRKLKR